MEEEDKSRRTGEHIRMTQQLQLCRCGPRMEETLPRREEGDKKQRKDNMEKQTEKA